MKAANQIKSNVLIALFAASLLSAHTAAADYLIYDDLVVTGSECVGFDCQDGESFSSDTLKLKEHNLRILFDDTSYTASYPANDWRIEVNSSVNGGASYFSIDDITGGNSIFRIEAGAPSNSLYVEDYGRVGLGTNTPVVELHIKDSDTPSVRLEQDSSGGWTAQTWDMAGNESNFFVRDATNGSKLPFRIQPDTPSSTLTLKSEGRVGIGTWNADETLHVYGSDGDTQLLIEEACGSEEGRILAQLENNGQPWIAFKNSATSDEFRFGLNGDGDFLVSAPGTGGQELNLSTAGELEIRSAGSLIFDLASNGDLAIAGTLSTGSSRTIKENFREVDAQEMLEKVANLPILFWNYIKDEADTPHVGPLAEEFYQAFGLGPDDKHLAPADAAGVALAAIQALTKEIKQKDDKIAELSDQVSELKMRFRKLEELLEPKLKPVSL